MNRNTHSPHSSSGLQLQPDQEYTSSTRLWQGIPGMERTSGGRLWATWYSGGHTEGPGNYVLLVSSEDDGKSWGEPILVIDPPGQVRAFDPCLWFDPLGRLWLFWAQSEAGHGEIFDGRGGVWAIVTGTPDATQPEWTHPHRICDGIMMNKPVVLSSGEWMLPVTIWKGEYRLVDAAPVEEQLAFVFVSTDAGQTWHRRCGVSIENRSFDEHMIIEKTDGRLWMLVRLKDGIGESFSEDGGWNWSVGRKTDLTQPDARFFIRRLQSGNLLLVKHHNFTPRSEGGDGRSHLTALLSYDDGVTWPDALLLDERNHVSYPDGIQADDGRIFVIYDRERYGAKEILLAIFDEKDIRAGRVIKPHSQLRKQVNKVTA